MLMRPAFFIMKAFQSEPQLLAMPKVSRRRRRWGLPPSCPHIGAADEIQAGMVEIVVGPVVGADALGRQAVPGVDVAGKQRETVPPWLWLK